MILDAGALLAVERNERRVMALLLAALHADDGLKTHPLVVAQVWRDPSGRQARLARFLKSGEVAPIAAGLGRQCGVLLGKARTSDPIDATVVLIADDGDVVMTSDPDDLGHLATVAGRNLIIVAC